MSKYVPALLVVLLVCTFSVFASEEKQEDTNKTPEELAEIEEKKLMQAVKKCVETLRETGLVNPEDGPDIQRYCNIHVRTQGKTFGRYAKRIINERMTEINPFVITPHKQSYILPVMVSDNFNTKPYEFFEDIASGMEEIESKYQVSFKVPLTEPNLFVPGDGVYFGMTIQAWWQVYSDEISKPFRETNYQPELFYMFPLPFKFDEGNWLMSIHFEHQSNGQTQFLSRSWNRILASITYEKDNYMLNFKPWHRLKENDKTDPLQPMGDDNPDILDYMGHYEFSGAYAFSDDTKVSFMLRKNWQTGNGAIEVNVTYPLWGRLIGMAQYFSGYGESMIDYNHKQQKLGIGIALTDIF